MHFWIALFMQITSMALTQFLDNFWAKIFNKHQGGVKIKVNIFMKVFEVCDLPPWVVTVLLGGDHPLWVVTTLLVVLTLLGRGLVYQKWVVTFPRGRSPTTKGGHQLEKFLKKWYCYFHTMSVFVKCIGLKIVQDLS